MPAAVAIKQALDNHDQSKGKRDAILKEAVETLSNCNLTEELLQVHQGKLQKQAVFDEKKVQFTEFFSRMGNEDVLIKQSNDVITQTWADFAKLK